MIEPVLLRISTGKYDYVKPLRDGRVTSSRVRLEFIDIEPLPKAFRLMVRGGDLDVCEMAVVTHLMAVQYGRPLAGLAIPLWSRLPHTNLVCPTGSAISGPRDLEGTKVGVRAYGQTSGVWVRGVLESDYGVDLDRITWVTMEDAHLPEYVDPPTAVRNQSSHALRPLMMAGELSAIMGEREVDPSGIRTVIPEAEKAAHSWVAKTGIQPVNHCLSIARPLTEQHPWLLGELMDMFEEARLVTAADGGELPPTYGLKANRDSLQLAFDYSARQKISPRRYSVDEIYADI